MSYPGPVGYPTNLGCDTGLQRATDQFNFVVDNGGGEPAPTVPNSLQSPATIIPAVNGSVSLTMAATGGNSGLSITSPNVSSVIVTGGADAVLTLATTGSAAINTSGIFLNSSGGNDENFIHFSDPTAAGIAVYNNPGTPGQLSIGNDAIGGNVVATFNQTTNVCNLGNPLNAGAIYLNNTTTVTSSASRPPVGGIVLTQTGATTSEIYQQVATGGSLNIGSSSTFPNTLKVSDVSYLGAGNYVEILGAPTFAPLFLSGAQGGAQQCGIHPDIGTGGQLLLGSSNTSSNQLQITDTTVQFNVIPNINTTLITTSARIPASGTMTSNTDYYITNPTAVGLYAIVVNVDNTAAGTNNAQVSSIAYWNGSIWDFGGSAVGSLFGGGQLFMGFGLFPPSAIRAGISVTFTGSSANPAVYVKCIPLYGNLGF